MGNDGGLAVGCAGRLAGSCCVVNVAWNCCLWEGDWEWGVGRMKEMIRYEVGLEWIWSEVWRGVCCLRGPQHLKSKLLHNREQDN